MSTEKLEAKNSLIYDGVKFEISYHNAKIPASNVPIIADEKPIAQAITLLEQHPEIDSLTVVMNGNPSCQVSPEVQMQIVVSVLTIKSASIRTLYFKDNKDENYTTRKKNNRLNYSGMEILADFLKTNPPLENLVVSLKNDEEFSTNCTRTLAAGLNHNITLRSLTVYFCDFTPKSNLLLVQAALRNSSPLWELNFKSHPHTFSSEKMRREIGKHLSVNKTLQVFGLAGLKLNSYYGLAYIINALKINATLCSLDISNCQLGDNGAEAMAEVLSCNSSLRTLNLSNNKIGLEGALAIAEALRHNSSLRTLTLSYNMLDSKSTNGDPVKNDGVIALADAIKTNFVLQNLSLEFHPACIDSVKAIREALQYNWTIQYINTHSWVECWGWSARSVANMPQVSAIRAKIGEALASNIAHYQANCAEYDDEIQEIISSKLPLPVVEIVQSYLQGDGRYPQVGFFSRPPYHGEDSGSSPRCVMS